MSDEERVVNNAEIREMIREELRAGFHEAMVQFFLTLGHDVSRPQGVLDLQEDLAYIRTVRGISATLGHRTLSVSFTLLIGALLLFILQHFGVNLKLLEHLID